MPNQYEKPADVAIVTDQSYRSERFAKAARRTDRQGIARHVSVQPFWKRSIDLLGASFGLVALTPVFLLTAVMIKSVSRGPVFFRHERVGLHGKRFQMWKFRTMHVSHDPREHQQYVIDLTRSNGVLRKMNNSDEFIAGAKVLRELCIDELPQLLNVWCGEMSLIGPRPDVIPIESYDDWQRERFDVLPGMTGLWQVTGKNHTTFEGMMQLDVTYARERSLSLDLKILLLTLPAVVGDLFRKEAAS